MRATTHVCGTKLQRACLALLLIASPAAAHETLEARLAALDVAVAEHPKDGALLLARASLLREEGRPERALDDVSRAAKVGADADAVARERGLALLEAAQPVAAADALARALASHPDDVLARAAHGRALALAGRGREAAAEYRRALATAPHAPSAPDWVLGEARALASGPAPDLDAALRVLDGAAAELGHLPAFDQLALDLELRAGRIEPALARLDRMAAAASRHEGLLVQRGEILEYAGRPDDAAASYGASLAMLEGRTDSQRATPAARQLAERARSGIERISKRGAE